MPAKRKPTGTNAGRNLASMATILTDEDSAREFLESMRWPDGRPVCRHCGGEGYALTPALCSLHQNRRGFLTFCMSARDFKWNHDFAACRFSRKRSLNPYLPALVG